MEENVDRVNKFTCDFKYDILYIIFIEIYLKVFYKNLD